MSLEKLTAEHLFHTYSPASRCFIAAHSCSFPSDAPLETSKPLDKKSLGYLRLWSLACWTHSALVSLSPLKPLLLQVSQPLPLPRHLKHPLPRVFSLSSSLAFFCFGYALQLAGLFMACFAAGVPVAFSFFFLLSFFSKAALFSSSYSQGPGPGAQAKCQECPNSQNWKSCLWPQAFALC